jgi:hypothetical protein
MTYQEIWSIVEMTKRPQLFEYENVVTEVVWQLQLIENQHVWKYGGCCMLGLPSDPMIPFQDLTQEQVVSWVQDILTPQYINSLRAQGSHWLATQRGYNITRVTVMPWQSPDPELSPDPDPELTSDPDPELSPELTSDQIQIQNYHQN